MWLWIAASWPLAFSPPTLPPDPMSAAELRDSSAAPRANKDPAPDPTLPPGPEPSTRIIEVHTGLPGRHDAFRHAGGRTVLRPADLRELGATSPGEVLARAPGVRSTSGATGLGGADTKLSVAVRGVNPRLSSRGTVLLDEIPIAPAPYGQPQLSLFPLSLFSIASADVVRGGAIYRYGPQTGGGVFNLVSHPIPEHPTLSTFVQGDSNVDFGVGTAYGGTHGPVGVYFEYAPRFGHGWRDHSDREVHGGMIKLRFQLAPKLSLTSSTHLFYEKSELPGGLSTAEYELDRMQSRRPFDGFEGHREATSLRLAWTPGKKHDVSVASYYSHTDRETTMASNKAESIDEIDQLVTLPRRYDVFGIEPRYTLTLPRNRVKQELSLGARAHYEVAKMIELTRDVEGVLKTGDDDGRVSAYAAFLGDKVFLLDEALVFEAGIRTEVVSLARRSNLEQTALFRTYPTVLPTASIWGELTDGLALFASYSRSFGPPQYMQAVAAATTEQLVPETADSVDAGFKIEELGGVYLDLSGWYKRYSNFVDVGEDAFDLIGTTRGFGTEVDLEWLPGEVWDLVDGFQVYGGYAWTHSRIIGGTYDGNTMPWYPEHEAWGGGSYELGFGLKLGADLETSGQQFTNYANRVTEDADDASTGLIPDYTLMNVYARMRTPLPRNTRLEFSAGVKNVFDVDYFTRTDDRNAGKLAERPRTFYFNIGFAHEFVRDPARPRERRRRRDQTAQNGISSSGPPPPP